MWGLKINTSKTKVVHFRKARAKLTNFKWTIEDEELEIVKRYKYLGLYVESSCSLSDAKNDICERANRAVFALWANVRRFGQVTPSIMLRLFDEKSENI